MKEFMHNTQKIDTEMLKLMSVPTVTTNVMPDWSSMGTVAHNCIDVFQCGLYEPRLLPTGSEVFH